MIEWIFSFLVFYLLYKLIFDFIVPVARASVQIKSKVNQMNSQQQRNYSNSSDASHAKPKPSTEDYIDFEEIK